MSDLYFSGDRDKKNEISAANFMKRLNILYRSNPNMTEAQKFTYVADRFEDQSAADKWLIGLKNTIPAPVATTDWAAFCAAFVARFKGADPVLKPRGQLEADLAHMRISMGELAIGTVVVRDRQVYALADFIECLDDAITEAGATAKDVGLWDFHNALPAVLQEGLGARTADWAAMVVALKAIPQTKIDAAVAAYKDREVQRVRVDHLEKRIGAMHISPQGPRGTSSIPTAPPASTVVDAPKGRRGRGGGGGVGGEAMVNVSSDQKEQLRKVLTECVLRRHPNTPAGLAAYAADIRTWNSKFGTIARTALQLELTGYPLTPGVQSPCTNECWACGVTMTPAHAKPAGCGRPVLPSLETALRALGGTWLGRTSLVAPVPVQLVAVAPVPIAGTWYEGEAAEEEAQDFVEGLQQ